jgi:hypothetical protein
VLPVAILDVSCIGCVGERGYGVCAANWCSYPEIGLCVSMFVSFMRKIFSLT